MPSASASYIGSGIGGFEVIEREHKILLEKGPRRISPFFIPATIINLASGYVSIRTGAKGPNSATATACTTSAHSIGDSFRIIQHDDADVMICGGAEAASRPWASADSPPCARSRSATTIPKTPRRPWDTERDGFIVGEGAGILILEELEHAKRRGAHHSGRDGRLWNERRRVPHHQPVGRRRRRISRDAQLPSRTPASSPSRSITSTRTARPPKWATASRPSRIKRVFGEHAYKLAVSSTKSMTGHLLGGAGGLEAGITVLAIRDQIAPPTINHGHSRSGVRSGLRSESRAADEDRLRAVEFVRVRRHQRLPDLQETTRLNDSHENYRRDQAGSRARLAASHRLRGGRWIQEKRSKLRDQ